QLCRISTRPLRRILCAPVRNSTANTHSTNRCGRALVTCSAPNRPSRSPKRLEPQPLLYFELAQSLADTIAHAVGHTVDQAVSVAVAIAAGIAAGDRGGRRVATTATASCATTTGRVRRSAAGGTRR